MLETGTFGLPQGSLFTELGSDNVFQAAPATLVKQKAIQVLFSWECS